MCPTEELEALVAEELDEASAERVRAHVAGCASCQAELKWLAAEAELMTRRRAKQPEVSPAIWQNIAERVAQPERQGATPVAAPTPIRAARRWSMGARIAYGGLLAAAAAAVVFASWPGQIHVVPGDLGGRPSVAERYDRMLSATRTQVADARATAGNDVDGRMVVLDGYAEYLRNLQTIVSDIR